LARVNISLPSRKHVEGAIHLTINNVGIIDQSMWDDVDQRWSSAPQNGVSERHSANAACGDRPQVDIVSRKNHISIYDVSRVDDNHIIKVDAVAGSDIPNAITWRDGHLLISQAIKIRIDPAGWALSSLGMRRYELLFHPALHVLAVAITTLHLDPIISLIVRLDAPGRLHESAVVKRSDRIIRTHGRTRANIQSDQRQDDELLRGGRRQGCGRRQGRQSWWRQGHVVIVQIGEEFALCFASAHVGGGRLTWRIHFVEQAVGAGNEVVGLLLRQAVQIMLERREVGGIAEIVTSRPSGRLDHHAGAETLMRGVSQLPGEIMTGTVVDTDDIMQEALRIAIFEAVGIHDRAPLLEAHVADLDHGRRQGAVKANPRQK
jgi:hypothetical protein